MTNTDTPALFPNLPDWALAVTNSTWRASTLPDSHWVATDCPNCQRSGCTPCEGIGIVWLPALETRAAYLYSSAPTLAPFSGRPVPFLTALALGTRAARAAMAAARADLEAAARV